MVEEKEIPSLEMKYHSCNSALDKRDAEVVGHEASEGGKGVVPRARSKRDAGVVGHEASKV